MFRKNIIFILFVQNIVINTISHGAENQIYESFLDVPLLEPNHGALVEMLEHPSLKIHDNSSLEDKKKYLVFAAQTIFQAQPCKSGDPFVYNDHIHQYLRILSQCLDMLTRNLEQTWVKADLLSFFQRQKEIQKSFYVIGHKLIQIGNSEQTHPSGKKEYYDQSTNLNNLLFFLNILQMFVKIYINQNIEIYPMIRFIDETKFHKDSLKILKLETKYPPHIISNLMSIEQILSEILFLDKQQKKKQKIFDIIDYSHKESFLELIQMSNTDEVQPAPSYAFMTQDELFKQWMKLATIFVKDSNFRDEYQKHLRDLHSVFLFNNHTFNRFLPYLSTQPKTIQEKNNYLFFQSLTVLSDSVMQITERAPYRALGKNFIKIYSEVLSEINILSLSKKTSVAHSAHEFLKNYYEINSGFLNSGSVLFDEILDEIIYLLQNTEEETYGNKDGEQEDRKSNSTIKKILEKREKKRFDNLEIYTQNFIKFLELSVSSCDQIHISEPYMKSHIEVFEKIKNSIPSFLLKMKVFPADQKILYCLESIKKKTIEILKQYHARLLKKDQNSDSSSASIKKKIKKKKHSQKLKKEPLNELNIKEDVLTSISLSSMEKKVEKISDILPLEEEIITKSSKNKSKNKRKQIRKIGEQEREKREMLQQKEHARLQQEHARLMQNMHPLVRSMLHIGQEDEKFFFYIVGGWIRDTLLNLHPRNFNLIFVGSEEKLLSLQLVGYPDFHIRKMNFKENQYFVEVPGSLDIRIKRVDFLANQEDFLNDIKSRDAYVNMLYMNRKELIDPTGKAWKHVMDENELLDTKGEPDLLFKEDPRRILRMIYLKVKLHRDYSLPVELAMQNHDLILELRKIPFPVLIKELEKILLCGFYKGFEILDKYKIIKTLFPDFVLEKKDDQFLQKIIENQNANFLDFHLVRIFLQDEVRNVMKQRNCNLDDGIKTVFENRQIQESDKSYLCFFQNLKEALSIN